MKVVSGNLKGRSLLSPSNKKIRPTGSRARSMIFNTLNSMLKKEGLNLSDLRVLDCFCGSGSIGIEALSQGAKNVLFLDSSYESLSLTKKNCEKLKLSKKSLFHHANILDEISFKYVFDLIFLDPPYGQDVVMKAIKNLYIHKCIKENCFGVFEVDKKTYIKEENFFKIIKIKKISNSAFFFFKIF